MLGIHWQRGVTRPVNASGASALQKSKSTSCSDCMTSHGGKVLATTRVIPILWGTNWNTPSFVQDKIMGLTSWYAGYPNSDYEDGTMSEYCSGSGMTGSQTCTASNPTKIQTHLNSGGSGVTFQATDIKTDLSPAAGGSKTANILQEVCKVIQQRATASSTSLPLASDYYPVYVDLPVSGGYCAYHSFGTCSYTPTGGSPQSVTIQFGFFWNADGDAGCASGDGPYSGTKTVNGYTWTPSVITRHSEGLGSLIDSTVHELSETRTDPGSPTAWIDANGAEDGDKCEWNTGYPGQNLTSGVPVVLFGSDYWVVQPEWSNLAAIQNGTQPSKSVQFAQESLSRKGIASGSYGCVYGLSGIGTSLTFQ